MDDRTSRILANAIPPEQWSERVPPSVLRAAEGLRRAGLVAFSHLDGAWFALVSTNGKTFAVEVPGADPPRSQSVRRRARSIVDAVLPIGTRSLLFGVHHWALHGTAALLGWRRVFGEWPTWREAVCIAIHDVGYLGKRTMDGPDGARHPALGGAIARKLFGREYEALVVLHSGRVAEHLGLPVSKLYAADKASIAYYPAWLYVLLARLTGEMREYRSTEHPGSRPTSTASSDFEWFRQTRDSMVARGHEVAAAFKRAEREAER